MLTAPSGPQARNPRFKLAGLGVWKREPRQIRSSSHLSSATSFFLLLSHALVLSGLAEQSTAAGLEHRKTRFYGLDEIMPPAMTKTGTKTGPPKPIFSLLRGSNLLHDLPPGR